MTGRGVAVQGGLALAGLVATYFTWQRAPELAAGEVIALDIGKNDLEKVRFDDQAVKQWAELVRDKDGDGAFVAVRMAGSDSSDVALPSSHPVVPLKIPERVVRGNESAQKLFDRFAPLRASRALGALDPAKLKDLGLDTTRKFIEVAARGSKRRYAIAPAPPGGNEPYVRDAQDGRVYIVSRQLLSDLQSASVNLVERRLHAFRLEDVDRLVLQAGAKKREFGVSRVENLPGVKLAPVATPDKPDQTAKNWHDRVFAAFPAEVMGRGEVPPEGPPRPSFRVEYFARGRPLGWIEVARNAPPPTTESTADSPPATVLAYARSEFTLGWVKLAADALALLGEGESLAAKP